MAAYRSNTGTAALESPKVRLYDNAADTFGSEIELSDTGSNVRDVRIKCSPISAKCVVVSLHADGTLNAWVCTAACDTASSWTDNLQADFADLWSAEPANPTRSFDICYEDQSGDLLVIYDKVSTVSAEELFYRVMSDAGTTFGSEVAIDTQTANSATDRLYPFVRCATDDGSDKIGRIELDRSNDDINAGIWSGSSWADNIDVTGASVAVDEEQLAIAWETNSGHLLACGSAGANIACREYTTSWQTAANVGGVATGVGNVNWISMKSTPRSAGNEIFMAFAGDLFDFATIQWSGTAWGTGTEHDAGIDSHGARSFDIALSPAADGDSANVDALLMWGTATNSISYRTWTATNTYGTASTISNSGTHPWISFPLTANPTSGDDVDAVGGTLDSAFDISRLQWTGNTNAPTDLDDELTADTVVTTWEAMYFDWIYQTFAQEFEVNLPTESPSLTEALLKTFSKALTTEASGMTEGQSLAFSKALATESTPMSEAIILSFTKALTTEASGMVENTALAFTKILDLESAGMSDAATGALTLLVNLATENLGMTDATVWLFTKALDTEAAGMAEGNSLQFSKLLGTESTAMVEGLSLSVTKFLDTEAATMSDAASGFVSLVVNLATENLGMSDNTVLQFSKSLALEGAGMVEGVSLSFTKVLSTETAGMVDLVTSAGVHFTVFVNEAMTMVDQIVVTLKQIASSVIGGGTGDDCLIVIGRSGLCI